MFWELQEEKSGIGREGPAAKGKWQARWCQSLLASNRSQLATSNCTIRSLFSAEPAAVALSRCNVGAIQGTSAGAWRGWPASSFGL